MSDAGIDQDGVEHLTGRERARGAHLDPRHRGEVLAGAGVERLVDLEADDAAGRTDAGGDDGGVVAEAGAEMQDAVTGRERERVDRGAEQRRRAVEEHARRVEGDGDVVIHVPGIGVGRLPRSGLKVDFAADRPRPSGQELLARHGGDRRRVRLDELHRITESPDGLIDLHDALDRFAAAEPLKAKLVELRFFAGLSVAEAADILGVSPATAARWWEFARLWLFADLRGEENSPPA